MRTTGVRGLRGFAKSADEVPPPSKAPNSFDTPTGCAGLKSFAAGTLVLMADGTRKRIEDIRVGDQVMAHDPETGVSSAQPVTRLWVHYDTTYHLTVTQDTAFTTGGVLPVADTITTTADHPIWSVTRKQWVAAGKLADGEQLLGTGGGRVTVKGARSGSVSPPGGREVVYNLTVAGPHTYLVGATDVLVHNTGCELDANGWPKAIDDGGNCDACAQVIHSKIGGKIVQFNKEPGTLGLGASKGNPAGNWQYHVVVVKKGRVYDAYTGQKGLPIEEYKAQFTEGAYIDFGF